MSEKKDETGREGKEKKRRLVGRSFQALEDSGTLVDVLVIWVRR